MDHHHVLLNLGLVITAAISAQWLAWRMKFPSILILLVFGLALGPIFQIVNTRELLNDQIFVPFVSIAVAIILFEGGLTLNMKELRKVGTAIRNILSIGVLVGWVLTLGIARQVLHLDWPVSILIASILIVTGPTVVLPIIRQIRLNERVGSVLKWEGIIIDPIGVTITVLALEIIIAPNINNAPIYTIWAILKTLLIGIGLGVLSSWLLLKVFERKPIPDTLQNALVLMFVVANYVISDLIQKESGLLTVTVMGLAMASQSRVNIKHVHDFKENLQNLLISFLFIILASRLRPEEIEGLNIEHLIFIGLLIFAVRPISVFLSTLGSSLNFREKLFLSFMAPRGIVAAAMSSIIALDMVHVGYEQASVIPPIIFFVIIGTVTFYSLTSKPLARLLKIANPDPSGIMIVGAHRWAIDLALMLKERNVNVMLVDTNATHVNMAKKSGLSAHQANILSENIFEELELDSVGQLWALTSNEEVNSISCIRFAAVIGRDKVFQLSSEDRATQGKKEIDAKLRGRILFSSGMTHDYIQERLDEGAVLATKTVEDAKSEIPQLSGPLSIPLFIITESGKALPFTENTAYTPKKGQTVVYLQSSVVD